jgi:hypothetical protein
MESPTDDKIDTRNFLDATLRSNRDLNDIEGRIKRFEAYQLLSQVFWNFVLG